MQEFPFIIMFRRDDVLFVIFKSKKNMNTIFLKSQSDFKKSFFLMF